MLKIDVFHDTACPWCRIGKRHLQLALQQWQGEAVDVTYHTFFLNPSIPAEGTEFRPYMRAKGGGRVPLEQFFEVPRERGEAVGLTFHFEDIERAPNTLLSHQLIALAPEEIREQVIDAVYKAYFELGQDIGDIDVLLDIAADQGMDRQQIREQLESGAGREQVLADARRAQELGISGVPFFIVDGRLAFSGAQPPELMLRVLEQAAAEKSPG